METSGESVEGLIDSRTSQSSNTHTHTQERQQRRRPDEQQQQHSIPSQERRVENVEGGFGPGVTEPQGDASNEGGQSFDRGRFR